MEEMMQKLYIIRDLAERKEQLDRKIRQLNSRLKNTEDLIEAKDANKNTRLGFAGYFVIFLILAYLIGRQILLYILNSDNVAFSMLFGFPFALICLPFVRIAVRMADKWRNQKNAADNQRNAKINERIKKSNEDITSSNVNIIEELAACRQKEDEIMQKLQSSAPWFPESYLQLEAVDFIISQLQTGRADSITQAIVHYEAMGK